jgi:hypothetical protein
LGLLGLLIIVFAPVDDTGDRRFGAGADLHQVQAGFLGSREGFGTRKYTKLSAVFAYYSQVGGADVLVDPGFFGYIAFLKLVR